RGGPPRAARRGVRRARRGLRVGRRSVSGAPRFELDAAVRRRDGGRLLVGGTPPRLLRVSAAGGQALDAILAGDEPTGAASALARRLERHGILHPLPGGGGGDPPVT